jgi:hypothetical protein
MDLAKTTSIRYRSSGHVRFEIPDALCSAPVSERLVAELRRIEGIYRVDLSPRQRKLSIRFIEHVCAFPALTRALYRLVSAVACAAPESETQAQRRTVPNGIPQRLFASPPVSWVREKWQEARETVAAMGVLARRDAVRQRARSLLSEETVIFILNDALALYLIRLHWPLITQQWIRRPWLHRYEWMASGYLMYLFVRSRRADE